MTYLSVWVMFYIAMLNLLSSLLPVSRSSPQWAHSFLISLRSSRVQTTEMHRCCRDAASGPDIRETRAHLRCVYDVCGHRCVKCWVNADQLRCFFAALSFGEDLRLCVVCAFYSVCWGQQVLCVFRSLFHVFNWVLFPDWFFLYTGCLNFIFKLLFRLIT